MDDDLARATFQPPQPDRETFGIVPADRTTMKLGGGMEEEKKGAGRSTAMGISLLD